MTKNSITPMIRYTNRMDGPARLMVLPEPMNSPVPMAPPMAINCRCRFDRLRLRCSGDDSCGCELGEGSIGTEERNIRGWPPYGKAASCPVGADLSAMLPCGSRFSGDAQ